VKETLLRCMHLHPSGQQCPLVAEEGSEFCADHTQFLEPDAGSDSRLPFTYRLTALALLLIFLYSYYQTVLGWLH
jgi:hypothetical protein